MVSSLALVVGTPADSSAFFPWLYDAMYGPPGYSYSYYAPYYGYYTPAYQTAYYAPGWSAWGGDCACVPACNACTPCSACSPCVGCSPCGPGGCPGGNCGIGPTPAGTPPRPEPDGAADPTAPPSRPSRPTFDPNADAPPYEPPIPRDSGSSGSRSRNLPADDFERRTPSRTTPTDEPTGTGTSTGNSSGTGDNTGFGDDPNLIPTPGASRKPPLNNSSETVIPARKPAEAAPVEESPNNSGPKLDERSTSRPIVEKQRLVLRSHDGTPNIVRSQGRATKWSGVDTHVARH